MKIREACAADLDRLVTIDAVAQQDAKRVEFIRHAVKRGQCLVCIDNDVIVGYGVLDYSFYAPGFVALLYVDTPHRRQSVGTFLMQALERRCATPKLFTSTNVSNLPMQALLRKLGYHESGIIFNLDPGDPELVYWKVLRANGASQVEAGGRGENE